MIRDSAKKQRVGGRSRYGDFFLACRLERKKFTVRIQKIVVVIHVFALFSPCVSIITLCGSGCDDGTSFIISQEKLLARFCCCFVSISFHFVTSSNVNSGMVLREKNFIPGIPSLSLRHETHFSLSFFSSSAFYCPCCGEKMYLRSIVVRSLFSWIRSTHRAVETKVFWECYMNRLLVENWIENFVFFLFVFFFSPMVVLTFYLLVRLI